MGIDHTEITENRREVTISDGKQFAYKVVTFYDESELSSQPILYYYPFTYNTYAGVDPRPVQGSDAVSSTDPDSVSDSDSN